MIKLYVIQKADKPNHYIRVVNNVPSVVTDIRKATVFQRNEAEKYINNQIKKSQRSLYTVQKISPLSPIDTYKTDTLYELNSIKETVQRRFSDRRNKYVEKLQYYDGVILDLRHYIRDNNTRLNACQAAKILFKLQKIERNRADIKREIQRIDLINNSVENAITEADKFEYEEYKPRCIKDMDEFLKEGD